MKIITGPNNPILRTPTLPIPIITGDHIAFGYKMLDTMWNANGVGLAAPQVGSDLRLFVATIRGKKNKKNTKEEIIDEEMFLNPEIISLSEQTTIEQEGCLSLPGLVGMVERSKTITIRFIDKYKQIRTQTFSGFTARIIQHEYDHLEGILYIDKLVDNSNIK